MQVKLNNVVLAFLLVSISVNLLMFATVNEESDEAHQNKLVNNYNIYSLRIPDSIHFCNEPAPLNNIDLKERFDKELLVNTYYQSQTLLFLKKAARWFPVIEPILAKNNIPNDFKYLCLIESGLENVVSPAGAKGFWQFMESTGLEFGLEINSEVDERYHVEKSTEAACKYLQEAYDRFGTWTLAAASYNMGMSGLDKQMKRQNAQNYYDLLLNSETARYVFRILAVKEILEKPTNYGFHVREIDKYRPYEFNTITIDTAVHDLPSLARDLDINYKILKVLNPWLRQAYLNNRASKSYEIKIPTKGFKPVEPISVELQDSL